MLRLRLIILFSIAMVAVGCNDNSQSIDGQIEQSTESYIVSQIESQSKVNEESQPINEDKSALNILNIKSPEIIEDYSEIVEDTLYDNSPNWNYEVRGYSSDSGGEDYFDVFYLYNRETREKTILGKWKKNNTATIKFINDEIFTATIPIIDGQEDKAGVHFYKVSNLKEPYASWDYGEDNLTSLGVFHGIEGEVVVFTHEMRPNFDVSNLNETDTYKATVLNYQGEFLSEFDTKIPIVPSSNGRISAIDFGLNKLNRLYDLPESEDVMYFTIFDVGHSFNMKTKEPKKLSVSQKAISRLRDAGIGTKGLSETEMIYELNKIEEKFYLHLSADDYSQEAIDRFAQENSEVVVFVGEAEILNLDAFESFIEDYKNNKATEVTIKLYHMVVSVCHIRYIPSSNNNQIVMDRYDSYNSISTRYANGIYDREMEYVLHGEEYSLLTVSKDEKHQYSVLLEDYDKESYLVEGGISPQEAIEIAKDINARAKAFHMHIGAGYWLGNVIPEEFTADMPINEELYPDENKKEYVVGGACQYRDELYYIVDVKLNDYNAERTMVDAKTGDVVYFISVMDGSPYAMLDKNATYFTNIG